MASLPSEEEIQYNKLNGLVHKYKFSLEKKLDSKNNYDQYVLFCNMFGFVPITMDKPNPKGAAVVNTLTNIFNSVSDKTDTTDIKIDTVESIESKVSPKTPIKQNKSSKPVRPVKPVKQNKAVDIKPIYNSKYAHGEVFFLADKETYNFILNKDQAVSLQSILFKALCEETEVQFSWMDEKLSFGLSSDNKEAFDNMKELLLEIIENAKNGKKTLYRFKKVFIPGSEIVENFISTKIDIGEVSHNAHTFMIECKEEDVDFRWNKEYGQFIIESKNEEKFNNKCEYMETILAILTDE